MPGHELLLKARMVLHQAHDQADDQEFQEADEAVAFRQSCTGTLTDFPFCAHSSI